MSFRESFPQHPDSSTTESLFPPLRPIHPRVRPGVLSLMVLYPVPLLPARSRLKEPDWKQNPLVLTTGITMKIPHGMLQPSPVPRKPPYSCNWSHYVAVGKDCYPNRTTRQSLQRYDILFITLQRYTNEICQ